MHAHAALQPCLPHPSPAATALLPPSLPPPPPGRQTPPPVLASHTPRTCSVLSRACWPASSSCSASSRSGAARSSRSRSACPDKPRGPVEGGGRGGGGVNGAREACGGGGRGRGGGAWPQSGTLAGGLALRTRHRHQRQQQQQAAPRTRGGGSYDVRPRPRVPAAAALSRLAAACVRLLRCARPASVREAASTPRHHILRRPARQGPSPARPSPAQPSPAPHLEARQLLGHVTDLAPQLNSTLLCRGWGLASASSRQGQVVVLWWGSGGKQAPPPHTQPPSTALGPRPTQPAPPTYPPTCRSASLRCSPPSSSASFCSSLAARLACRSISPRTASNSACQGRWGRGGGGGAGRTPRAGEGGSWGGWGVGSDDRKEATRGNGIARRHKLRGRPPTAACASRGRQVSRQLRRGRHSTPLHSIASTHTMPDAALLGTGGAGPACMRVRVSG